MRSIVKLTFLMTLVFAACIGLIRAQPYDDSELRAFLTPPDGCPMPCFMGIRPGVTTAEEVMTILEAHEWVGSIAFRQNEIFIAHWTGLQPKFIDISARGFRVYSQEGVVNRIAIETTISAADVQVLLGVPSLVYIFTNQNLMSYPNSETSVRSYYSNNFLQFNASRLPCPLNVEYFWKADVQMLVLNEHDIEAVTGLPQWDRRYFREINQWCG